MTIKSFLLGLFLGSCFIFSAPSFSQTDQNTDGIWRITSNTGVETITDGTDLTYSIFYIGSSETLTTYVTVAVGWSGKEYRLYNNTPIDVASNGKPIQITGKVGDTGYFRSVSAVEPWKRFTGSQQTLVDGTNLTYSLYYPGNPAGDQTSYVVVEVAWSGRSYRLYGDSYLEVSSKGKPITLSGLKANDSGTYEALRPKNDISLKRNWKTPTGLRQQTITDGTQHIYRLTYSGAATNFVTVTSAWNGVEQRLYGGAQMDVSSYGKPIVISSTRLGEAGTYTVVGLSSRKEDVNGDLSVDVRDAILVLRAAIGLSSN